MPAVSKTILEIIKGSRNLTKIAALVKHAGLEATLNGTDQITAFIPVDDAFDKLDEEARKILTTTADPAAVASALKYHVVPGALTATDVKDGTYKTVHGANISIVVTTHKQINFTSRIIETDLKATNGVIHLLETVLTPEPLTNLLSRIPKFSLFVTAAKAAGLWETLGEKGPFTLYVPNDEAFKKLGSQLNDLLKPENKEKLVNTLKFHALGKVYKDEDMEDDGYFETLAGNNIHVANREYLRINGYSQVIGWDYIGVNGIFHELDSVLVPHHVLEAASAHPKLSTFIKLVKAAGMDQKLSAFNYIFTVLAPSDDAFAALGSTVDDLLKPEQKDTLTDILAYHILPQQIAEAQLYEGKITTTNNKDINIVKLQNWRINGSSIIKEFDFMGLNGVVHIIDTVLSPTSVLEYIGSNSSLSTLSKVLKESGLVELLQEVGAFTVYAPTNDAFAKIPADKLNELLQPENKEKLVEILKTHVFHGVDRLSSLKEEKPESFRAVHGKSVKFGVRDDGIFLGAGGASKVVKADIWCSNGIIHIIDNVITERGMI